MGKHNKTKTQPMQSLQHKKTNTVSKVKAKKQISNLAGSKNFVDDANFPLKKPSKIAEDKTSENILSLNIEKKINETSEEKDLTSSVSNSKHTIRTKQFLNPEEAQVNDDEIDRFCDEIDDEDNKQFEIWVKEIELKLHSNSKK